MKNTSKIVTYLQALQKLWGERFKSLPLLEKKASVILWKGSTEGMSNSGCSWRSLLLTSWHKRLRSCTGDAVIDLIFTKKKKKKGNWPGMWNQREVLAAETISSGVEFRIHRWSTKAKPRIRNFDFKREDFGLFRYLLGSRPWRQSWRRKRVLRKLVGFQG